MLLRALILVVFFLNAVMFGQSPQKPAQPLKKEVTLQDIDPDSDATCITRPGKLEPLVVQPVENSAYYHFLKYRNRSWFQKIKDFFKRIFD